VARVNIAELLLLGKRPKGGDSEQSLQYHRTIGASNVAPNIELEKLEPLTIVK
jgi:hypothetical protein